MRLKDITDVLKFASFRPEADDRTTTWKRRFPHQKTLLLNVGKARTSWKQAGRKGQLLDGGSMEGDFKDIVGQMGLAWSDLTDEGWCCASLNARYVISLETNLSRNKAVEEVIVTNPRSILGGRFEKGKRYAITHNPESNTSLVLSVDEEAVKKLEANLKECDLKPGRICVGTYAMLRNLLEIVHNGKDTSTSGEGNEGKGNLYIVCCEGSFCGLLEQNDQWVELRSRSELYTDSFEPVVELVASFGRRLAAGSNVYVVVDQAGTPLASRLYETFPQFTVSDFSKPDHLWSILAETD